jgi:hypothetical protein
VQSRQQSIRFPRSAPRGWLLVLALVLGPAASCATDGGYPPVARITFAPGNIPENDGFQTPVVLDGSTSADPVDDPENQRPLRYAWEIIGDEYRVTEGSLSSSMLTVTLLGERPATIALTVTDEDGNAVTARKQLQLTVMP